MMLVVQWLNILLCYLQCEGLSGMNVASLEELQSFHVEALSKICQEKVAFSNIFLVSLCIITFLGHPLPICHSDRSLIHLSILILLFYMQLANRVL